MSGVIRNCYRAWRLRALLESGQREADRDGDDPLVRQRRVPPFLHRLDRGSRKQIIHRPQHRDVADDLITMSTPVIWSAGTVSYVTCPPAAALR